MGPPGLPPRRFLVVYSLQMRTSWKQRFPVPLQGPFNEHFSISSQGPDSFRSYFSAQGRASCSGLLAFIDEVPAFAQPMEQAPVAMTPGGTSRVWRHASAAVQAPCDSGRYSRSYIASGPCHSFLQFGACSGYFPSPSLDGVAEFSQEIATHGQCME